MILVNQTCISCWEWARWIDKLINNVYIWSMLGFMAVILSQGAKEKGRPGDIFFGGVEKPNGLKSQDKSINHLQASFEICLAQCWDLRCSPFKKINIFLLFPQKTCFFSRTWPFLTVMHHWKAILFLIAKSCSSTWPTKERLGGGNSNIFYFHPEIWGRFPFWLIFFQMGWNHQPEDHFGGWTKKTLGSEVTSSQISIAFAHQSPGERKVSRHGTRGTWNKLLPKKVHYPPPEN